MTDREALLSAALGQPEDDTARLVLADLLRERSDSADVALGRFLWAGVVVVRFRTPGEIPDAALDAALAEQSAVCPGGQPGGPAPRLDPSPPTRTPGPFPVFSSAKRVGSANLG